MGYELPRRIREGQQVNTRIAKISTSWDTSYHDGCSDKKGLVRASPANRDTTPLSGRAPSLEGPRGDEVDLLTPLTFHSVHRLGPLKALTTPVHFGVYVSDSIL
jgi:hypothetical protein